MNRTFVFGYGSLVNRATHEYTEAHPVSVPGWRRTWRHIEARSVAFLTAVPDPQSAIEGLIAEVPASAWQALDQREHSYVRATAADVAHPRLPNADIHIYHAPEGLHPPSDRHHPILLSYLDVVVQGYLREFGETGVTNFFATTDGWEAPVLDDRNAPRYGRHRQLTTGEHELTDWHLRNLGVTRIHRTR